jgi:alanine-glyoxylate transaminase/serine-glyoxylate transaminase/serine-pyruvate transaminase
MDETCELLRQAWGTTNSRTLPLSATGSAGMEAAFVNTVHEGDVVVVGVNGLFGQRMCDVAARCGAEVVAVEHEWGTPVEVQNAQYTGVITREQYDEVVSGRAARD